MPREAHTQVTRVSSYKGATLNFVSADVGDLRLQDLTGVTSLEAATTAASILARATASTLPRGRVGRLDVTLGWDAAALMKEIRVAVALRELEWRYDMTSEWMSRLPALLVEKPMPGLGLQFVDTFVRVRRARSYAGRGSERTSSRTQARPQPPWQGFGGTDD